MPRVDERNQGGEAAVEIEVEASGASGVASLGATVDRIAAHMSNGMGTGDLARLRRGTGVGGATTGSWSALRVALHHLPNASDDELERWAPVLSAMAHLVGLHRPGIPLGAALAEVGCSELRLSRLLSARRDAVAPQLRSVVALLESKAARSNHADIARLVLSAERSDREYARRRVAIDYYRAVQRQETPS